MWLFSFAFKAIGTVGSVSFHPPYFSGLTPFTLSLSKGGLPHLFRCLPAPAVPVVAPTSRSTISPILQRRMGNYVYRQPRDRRICCPPNHHDMCFCYTPPCHHRRGVPSGLPLKSTAYWGRLRLGQASQSPEGVIHPSEQVQRRYGSLVIECHFFY